jgi:hypothetical protein
MWGAPKINSGHFRMNNSRCKEIIQEKKESYPFPKLSTYESLAGLLQLPFN